jgi:hypothetical protein
MKAVSFALAAFLLLACQNGRSQTMGAGAVTGENAKYYSVQISPAEVPASTEASVVVAIVPASGWKWNAEYPAKFKLSSADGVKLGKSEFSTRSGDVQADKDATRLSVPGVVAGAGAHSIDVTGSFSVCNETSCKIMRDEKFTLALTGR